MKNIILYISLFFNLLFLATALFALNRYGGWKNLWAKINNRGIEQTYFHRKNLFEKMPERDSGIVFLGNSITAQGEWAELFDDKNILNRGIPGDHCDGVRQRLKEIAKLRPKKLFLMIGVNDLMYHPPETVALKYETLVAALLEQLPTTTIYLQGVFPINNQVLPTSISNEAIRELNADIRQLAEKYMMVFLDTYPLLLDANGNLDAKYTNDGVHLNGEAYMKWREFLLPIVKDNC